MISRTTCIELYKFCTTILKRKSVSKQAFSFARGNLNHEVFIRMNELFIDDYYEEDYKTHKDYLILACDGSSLSLPKTDEFINDFGCASNHKGVSQRPVAKSSILLDINNNMIINGILNEFGHSEQSMMIEHIEKIKKISNLKNKKMIILFDRYYPSMELMVKLKENNINFIIRSKRAYIKQTEIVGKYSNYDKVKKIKITSYMTKGKPWLKQYFKEKSNEISLRFVSGKFKDGEIGIFITNLGENIFNREEIVELYRRRWEIETHFRHQKEACEFENFACKTTLRLYQEYHCKLYTINFASLLTESAQEEVDKKIKSGEIKSKHELKINRNVAIGFVKDNLPRILFFDDSGKFTQSLITEIARHTIPVIKDRVFERNFHIIKQKFTIPYRRAS